MRVEEMEPIDEAGLVAGARRAGALDPTDEAGGRRLMKFVHTSLGRNAAVRAHEELAGYLRCEYNAEPSAAESAFRLSAGGPTVPEMGGKTALARRQGDARRDNHRRASRRLGRHLGSAHPGAEPLQAAPHFAHLGLELGIRVRPELHKGIVVLDRALGVTLRFVDLTQPAMH
jgi:hypothetical protein